MENKQEVGELLHLEEEGGEVHQEEQKRIIVIHLISHLGNIKME